MGSRIYDLALAVLRGRSTSAEERRRAFAEPITRWRRVLNFDGCAVQFDRALHRTGHASDAPPALRRLLREEANESLRRALLVHGQLGQLAAPCARDGIRVMALKGAARLLAGEAAGTRSIADIDLLVAPADAARLHALLRRELDYAVSGEAYPHHLAGLTRPGSLGVEVHVRLTPTRLPLDTAIWTETRSASAGGYPIVLPSPTNLLLHTLEHAVRVNWAARYRLRDILDVAALFTAEVDCERVLAYVAASDCRRPMRTILGAARELQPAIPVPAAHAWRTVRRVGSARLAFATVPRTPLIAERWFRWVGVVAEGSPNNILRLALGIARRTARAAAAASILGIAGCVAPAEPQQLVVPPFVFASRTGATWGLYRFRGGVVDLISNVGSDDREPSSAGQRVVFTSLRDGNAEIYTAVLTADLALGAQTRLTREYGNDNEPALSPSGATIAFVSSRSGTPRVWLMDMDGSNARALDTGSPEYVPEASPRWSPSGDRLAFISTRSGSAQVYSVAAGGGTSSQLSRETRGAFFPSWSPDGRTVIYTVATDGGRLMSVPATGGAATVFATDGEGLGEAACNVSLCLAVARPLGAAGHIVVLGGAGRHRAEVLVPAVGDDHHPAFINP